jgi:hypothetical protein
VNHHPLDSLERGWKIIIALWISIISFSFISFEYSEIFLILFVYLKHFFFDKIEIKLDFINRL